LRDEHGRGESVEGDDQGRSAAAMGHIIIVYHMGRGVSKHFGEVARPPSLLCSAAAASESSYPI